MSFWAFDWAPTTLHPSDGVWGGNGISHGSCSSWSDCGMLSNGGSVASRGPSWGSVSPNHGCDSCSSGLGCLSMSWYHRSNWASCSSSDCSEITLGICRGFPVWIGLLIVVGNFQASGMGFRLGSRVAWVSWTNSIALWSFWISYSSGPGLLGFIFLGCLAWLGLFVIPYW